MPSAQTEGRPRGRPRKANQEAFVLRKTLFVERGDFLHRNIFHVVVEIRVIGSRNNHERLIVAREFLESVFAEIQRVRFFAVDHQYRIFDFIRES